MDYTERLNSENCVFVFVDYTTGFLPGLRSIDPETYLNNVTAFSQLPGIFDIPAIVLGDEGGWRGLFFQCINEHLADAPRVERIQPSACAQPAFLSLLEDHGRRKVVMGGISICNCLMHTAIDLIGHGYDVYVVVDCSGTDSELVETAAMMRLTQAGAVMTSWVSLGSELLEDWDTPQGPKLGALYIQYSKWGSLARAVPPPPPPNS